MKLPKLKDQSIGMGIAIGCAWLMPGACILRNGKVGEIFILILIAIFATKLIKE